MASLLGKVIVWAMGSFLTRLLAALGLSVATYAGLSSLVTASLNQIEPLLTQLPSTVLALISLAGIGQGLTIILSAVATRAAFLSAQTFISIIK